MTIELGAEDLEKLAEHFPDLNLSDEERRKVLLCSTSVDVQAAPGSGKTTLLGIKLALLASKWQEQHRGICILSHTNVARSEIEKRLAKIPGGLALLHYPHYVGTIQTFVHTFLALPLLRSRQVRIECVDDDKFAKRATAAAPFYYKIKAWLKHPNSDKTEALATLQYEGPDLELGSAEGKVPKAGVTRPELEKLKRALTSEGLFRFNDMFAFAQHTLATWPSTSKHLSCRFPLVFIDEMQDTSALAELVLSQVFDSSVVIQRFGDVNQAILSSQEADTRTFPKEPYLTVSSSMRFGSELAKATSALRTEGPEIIGHGEAGLAPATILVYDDTSITRVIPHFGEYVASLIESSESISAPIKAICARRNPMDNPRVGSSVDQYWPTYVHQDTVPILTRQNIAQLLASASTIPNTAHQLTIRVNAAKTALIRLLRLAGLDVAKEAQRWGQLTAALGSDHPIVVRLNALAYRCVTSVSTFESAELSGLVHRFCRDLKGWISPEITPEALLNDEELQMLLSPSVGPSAELPLLNEHRLVKDGKEFSISVGTIANVKGETHFATLVLESFQKSSFDVEMVLPILCGEQLATGFSGEVARSHIKNMFVAVSRPSHILCLAVHHERLGHYGGKLVEKGWKLRQV